MDAVAVPASSRMPAWLEIPQLAGRLLWRHWPALLCWFFAQRVAYDLGMAAAIRLAEVSALLAYAAIAALIVGQLACHVGMFLALRPSLPPAQDGATLAALGGSAPAWSRPLAVALLPFFAYYAGWGLMEGIQRDFRLRYIFGIWHEQQEPLHDILALQGLWIALAAAWVLRAWCKRRMAASPRARWHVLATLCEAYWVFVGVAAIVKLKALAQGWWQERSVYAALTGWWENPVATLPLVALPAEPARQALGGVWAFLSTAGGAAALPLVWLAIVAMIYGLDLARSQRIDAADARLEGVAARYRQMHFAWRKAVDRASAGWSRKGVPIVNSVRLVLRAGLPALLTLCLGWQLLAFADAWAWRLAVDAIGPREPDWWNVIGQPIALLFDGPLSLRPSLVTTLLRTVLLAATFACAVRRLPPAAPEESAAPAPDSHPAAAAP